MVKTKFLVSVMAMALMWMSAAWASPIAAIAMVTAIHGTGVIDTQSGQLKKLDVLSAPGTITVGAAAKVVVFYLDGAKEYTLSGPGTFEFSAAGLIRSSASGALLIKRQDPAYGKTNLLFKVPATQAGVVLMASGTNHNSQGDDDIVSILNPYFSWKMRPHQGAWQFRIIDANAKVLHETTPSEDYVTLSGTLAPDQLYQWKVSWIDSEGNQQSEIHRFRTMDAKLEASAARLKPGHDAPEAQRTLYGLWLVSEGAHRLGQTYLSDSLVDAVMP